LLQRTIGNRATAQLLRQPRSQQEQQRQPPPPAKRAPPPAPRPDYVFIMGDDPRDRRGNATVGFYKVALEYWKVHLPGATFVTDKRDLDAVLTYLAGGSGPIGNVYLVSHANEDGTLAFGLEAVDTDHRLTVPELRDALHPLSGTSRLTSIKSRVDRQTRIHIKGCDIGRTKPMVELIDEAFGGAGVVDAPTHEQEYGTDSTLAAHARQRFRADVEAKYPMPESIDPTLKGAAKAAAKRDRDKAVRYRQKAINDELKTRQAEADTAATLAGHYEAFSGPMFQRPGTQLFTSAELRKEIDRLYPHLSKDQRAALAAAMIRMDRGKGLDQHGQRLVSHTGPTFTFPEIKTVAEANAAFGKDFRKERFTAKTVTTTRKPVAGGFEWTTVVKGQTPDDPNARREFFSDGVVPGDAEMLAQGKHVLPNPDSYAWRIEEKHAAGQTVRAAIAERVVTYMHHGSLDAAPHDHFTRPYPDKDFYATSTFGDPPPPAPKKTPAPATAPRPAQQLHRSPAAPAGQAVPPARRVLHRQPNRSTAAKLRPNFD
jgi:hypothetical protein